MSTPTDTRSTAAVDPIDDAAPPTGWGFLRSRRWAGYLALTIVFAIVCCFLGSWQLARRAEALEKNRLVAENYDAPARPVAEVMPELDQFDAEDTWQPVELTGRYLLEDQVLVRGRPYQGAPGFEVLTPFQTTDGTVFIVDRGWLPTGQAQDSPDVVPSPPTGTVTVTARLKAGEPTIQGRGAGEGQIATIYLPDLAERVDEPTYTGAYGLLMTESPAPPEQPPSATIRPEEDEGPHLSYAFQWFVFALLGFLGLGYIARQEYRAVNADDPEERERAAARDAKRRAKRTDADVEDEILDRSSG